MSYKGRQQANVEILNSLYELVSNYPDLRFGQLLAFAGVTQVEIVPASNPKVIDIFHEESTETLARLSKTLLSYEK